MVAMHWIESIAGAELLVNSLYPTRQICTLQHGQNADLAIEKGEHLK